jgi:hypothetical protein
MRYGGLLAMASLAQLQKRTEDFEDAGIDIDEFENWFRDEFRGAYSGPNNNLSAAVVAVEEVLSRYHFEGASEDSIRKELATAVYPFSAAVRVYAHPIEMVPLSQKTAAFRPIVLRPLSDVSA